MPWIRMVRREGQEEFRLRPANAWSEVVELEVGVDDRAGRAREARRIIRRLTRMGLVGRQYRARRRYMFGLVDLRRLQIVCWPHRRAICCNRVQGGADA